METLFLFVFAFTPVPLLETTWGASLLAQSPEAQVLEGRFEERRLHPFLKEPLRVRGRFAWSPGELHWYTEEPEPAQLWFSHGAPEFRLYYPGENVAELYPREIHEGWEMLGAPLKELASQTAPLYLLVHEGNEVVLGFVARRTRWRMHASFFRLHVEARTGTVDRVVWRSRTAGEVTIAMSDVHRRSTLPDWCVQALPPEVRRVRMGKRGVGLEPRREGGRP